MNWRKPVLAGAMPLFGNAVYRELQMLRTLEFRPVHDLQGLHEERLAALLRHAWATTDYYKEVLSDCGVVRDGTVDLSRFEEIPFLTKDIIREQQERLRSKALPAGRKAYTNSSGGSTGQPCQFWQDTHYWDVNVATKLYHFEVVGKQIGEPELKIWGSEYDLVKGSESLTSRCKNWLYNRRSEQCFHLPEARIREIIDNINAFKPKIIWAYRDGIDTVARYINQHGIEVHRPAAIACGGGTLYPYIVEAVEQAFQAPVINIYGSREVGDVACACRERSGLHISLHSHKVEVVDERGAGAREGELVVTALHNYALPFVRYRIGDRAALAAQACACGRSFPLLEHVSGRMIEVLVNRQGDTVDAIYLIQLFGVYYNSGMVRRFQVVQEDYDLLKINIIPAQDTTPTEIRPHLAPIVDKIKAVMGNECRVEFAFVDEIPLTRSGKHPYVIRKVPLPREDMTMPEMA